MNVETNVFSYIDSVKRGDVFTKLEFNTEQEPLSLTISINAPVKDSVPEKNYARIMKNEFDFMNFSVVSENIRTINSNSRRKYI